MKYANKLKSLTFAILCSLRLASADELPEKPLVVLTTSYNNANWCYANLQSIFMQKYSNYRVIYIDDTSDDRTADLVEQIVRSEGQQVRFQLIRNTERMGSLANIYHGVQQCRDDEIIVSLDGDDWFYDEQVLNRINRIYSNPEEEVWITHGSFVEYPTGASGWSIPVPLHIAARNGFREYRCPSHLRTFYAWLFKKIDLKDLTYDGKFFSMTWDQAMLFPMFEMAAERHAFVEDVVYVYNVANPLNDNKVDPVRQRDLEWHIRAMPPYERLERGPYDPE
jgi:glycosyltransferase involved in cell wall biosynthesis